MLPNDDIMFAGEFQLELDELTRKLWAKNNDSYTPDETREVMEEVGERMASLTGQDSGSVLSVVLHRSAFVLSWANGTAWIISHPTPAFWLELIEK